MTEQPTDTPPSDAERYPRLTALNIPIVREQPGPPGVLTIALGAALIRERLWTRWLDWGLGITYGPNGIYPWDVEDFLSGLPNTD